MSQPKYEEMDPVLYKGEQCVVSEVFDVHGDYFYDLSPWNLSTASAAGWHMVPEDHLVDPPGIELEIIEVKGECKRIETPDEAYERAMKGL